MTRARDGHQRIFKVYPIRRRDPMFFRALQEPESLILDGNTSARTDVYHVKTEQEVD